MKNSTLAGRLVAAKRMRNSHYGNPRWMLTIEGLDGERHEVRTKVDASLGYEVENLLHPMHAGKVLAFMIDGRGNAARVTGQNGGLV